MTSPTTLRGALLSYRIKTDYTDIFDITVILNCIPFLQLQEISVTKIHLYIYLKKKVIIGFYQFFLFVLLFCHFVSNISHEAICDKFLVESLLEKQTNMQHNTRESLCISCWVIHLCEDQTETLTLCVRVMT